MRLAHNDAQTMFRLNARKERFCDRSKFLMWINILRLVTHFVTYSLLCVIKSAPNFAYYKIL